MVSQGKNAANPFGLASILTQDERKSACIKHGSDNSFHPKEETGLDVEVGNLIGVYTDCDVVCANGDEVQSICIAYEMTVVGGELVCDKDETLELKYFSLDDMPELFCEQHEELLRDIKKGEIK